MVRAASCGAADLGTVLALYGGTVGNALVVEVCDRAGHVDSAADSSPEEDKACAVVDKDAAGSGAANAVEAADNVDILGMAEDTDGVAGWANFELEWMQKILSSEEGLP